MWHLGCKLLKPARDALSIFLGGIQHLPGFLGHGVGGSRGLGVVAGFALGLLGLLGHGRRLGYAIRYARKGVAGYAFVLLEGPYLLRRSVVGACGLSRRLARGVRCFVREAPRIIGETGAILLRSLCGV